MDFVETAQEMARGLLRLRPEWATGLGEHSYDDRLNDLSDAGERELRTFAARCRGALATVDAGGLTVSDRVDLDIARVGLDRILFDLELGQRQWNPLVWLPGDALYPLLIRETTPVAHRLRSLAGRMSQIPDRLALARATLANPPRVHVETALTQTNGTLQLVRDEVSKLLTEEPSLRALVVPAQAAADEALVEFRTFLAAQADSADGDPRLGPELFSRRLPLVLDSGLAADEIVSRARTRLDELHEQLRSFVGGDDDAVRAAFDAIGLDAPDNTTVVPLARQAYADATEAVRRLGLVSVPDEVAEVVVMPEARRGVAVAYCDPPGPFEVGGTTLFAVSPTPADWPPDRVASFYREYNSAMIVNLSVHEAMPGHALQLARARQWRGSTVVRHLFESGPFMEGWAVHAEEIMALAGHGGRPVRLQQLKMQLRCTVNALLDAGVHAGGMTEAEGMDLMMRRGLQEEGEAIGKWRRAQLSSCQLSSYFVGYTELKPTLAGLTNFDEVLAHASPPPRHLPRLLAG
ncbi:MAG: hypothetical protein QOI76_625 [Frankiales bacterium]|nr:hypothetical protein [Frankiales bacterium]